MKLTVFIALLQWTQAQTIVPIDYFYGKQGTQFGWHGQLIAGKGRGTPAQSKLEAWQTYFLTVRQLVLKKQVNQWAWQPKGVTNLRNLSLKMSGQTSGVANLVMKNVGKLEGVANQWHACPLKSALRLKLKRKSFVHMRRWRRKRLTYTYALL